MNNTLKTKLIKYIDDLLSRGLELDKRIQKTSKCNSVQFSFLQSATGSLSLKLVGENGPHYKYLQQITMSNATVWRKISWMIGTLESLKVELEQGLIGEVEDLVRGEVFTDFLEMAQHLLETGYKDPAAILVGGVLEDGLKKIAEKNDIQFKNNAGIGVLNKSLAKANVYKNPKKLQIQAWADIRNSAAHGKSDEYEPDEVKYMLEGVQNFLSEHLG